MVFLSALGDTVDEMLRDSGMAPEKQAEILADLQAARLRHRSQAQ